MDDGSVDVEPSGEHHGCGGVEAKSAESACCKVVHRVCKVELARAKEIEVTHARVLEVLQVTPEGAVGTLKWVVVMEMSRFGAARPGIEVWQRGARRALPEDCLG